MPQPWSAPEHRRWWLLGGALVTVAVTLISWYAVAITRDHVSYEVVSYRVVDDASVRVTFEVHRPRPEAATCEVRAIGADFATVGSLQVRIPAGGADSVRRSEVVRTTSRAVTGTVRTCLFDQT